MAKERSGNTALGAAICRLIEQSQPEETRLFNDQVIKDLVGTPIRLLMQFAIMHNYTLSSCYSFVILSKAKDLVQTQATFRAK